MKIKLSSAINRFFPNSSFKMIYSEAMANALDANATSLHIDISIQSFNEPSTLIIKIKDNGDGFSDENFQRFSHLMDTKDDNHKGLGRLVFLKYFSLVKFESIFRKDEQQFIKRYFLFNERFNGEKEDKIIDNTNSTGTTLIFKSFCNKALNAYADITPNEIIAYLTNCFLPRLYAKKQSGSAFVLKVSSNVEEENIGKDFQSCECSFSLEELPVLQEKIINNRELDIFHSEFNLLYYIDKNNSYKINNITALCIDDRAMELDVLDKQALPETHKFIFLLKSEYLNQKIDNARQDVTLNEQELKVLKRIFLEQISEIISEKIPEIEEKNNQTRQTLSIKFPHLEGLFPKNSIGFLNEYQSVEFAQDKLFEEQKEILMAETLSNEMYEKSLVQASRVLAEYILYRNKIIQKLKNIEANDEEKKIHNLIVPMQKTLHSENHFENRFINNAWLLDDKYMSYQTILSDENIEKLIQEIKITDEQDIPNDVRPDIAFVFSDDINTCDHPVDVVVVELKKKNLGYLDNKRVIDQLEQRAKRLLAYYPKKIQRMWFFGIVEIDTELRDYLEEKWIQLYSKGDVFYKEENLFPVNKNKERIGTNKFPVAMTIMSFDALWKDAEARNNSFLDIFRKAIQDYTKQND